MLTRNLKQNVPRLKKTWQQSKRGKDEPKVKCKERQETLKVMQYKKIKMDVVVEKDTAIIPVFF